MSDAEAQLPAEPETGGLRGEEPAFDPLAEAKRLLRSIRSGALATLTASGDPFSTLITVATDHDGSPLLLVSQLSAHTRHLDGDPRCSLLLAETGPGDPLAHARLTLTGKAVKVTEPQARLAVRARFLAKHSKAELYADFGDFSFWRISMEQAHLNGGFARAARFPASRLLTSLADAETLIAAEANAVAHMNADHAEALALYAQVIAGQPAGAWCATGIDPDGMDLACGDQTARLAFPQRITSPGDLRRILVELATRTRTVPG